MILSDEEKIEEENQLTKTDSDSNINKLFSYIENLSQDEIDNNNIIYVDDNVLETSDKSQHLIGQKVIMDGREFLIETIKDISGDVSMRDLSSAYPINRVEKIETVKKYLEQLKQLSEADKIIPKGKIHTTDLFPNVSLSERNQFKITNDNLGVNTPGQKILNNINAIILLKQLESERRYAKSEEQAVLSQYVGWA